MAAWLLASCQPSFHRCDDDEQCRDGTRLGVCAAGGHCAFLDDGCSSGYAYGDEVDPQVAGQCVPSIDGTGTSELGSSSVGPGSSSGDVATSIGPPPSDDTLGADCPAGVGGPCQPDDPCATLGVCNDAGACIPTDAIPCDDPPSPCHAARGECQPDLGCIYPPLPMGTSCDDGDPCTVDDACDGAGSCTSGEECPSTDPCEASQCEGGGCVSVPLPDGASCGTLPSERCCSGACVDISTDDAHCGGCNSPCAPGRACESVAETANCELAPADTSGRCNCIETAECPLGQLCRTQAPYLYRCAPSTSNNCDGVMVEVQLCPNYCDY